ncbi:MAG: UDP-glucose dehydrogenase family protein [Burkholderiales bacterium]
MKLSVVGTGYVGLVTGACFAEMGNIVTCVDIDEAKIGNLKNGILPIYEPGLEEIVVSNYREGRLKFTTSLPESLEGAQACFIAVGTPPEEDGSADLKHVLAVATEIGQNLNDYCAIVDKSTVPVGTAERVREAIQSELGKRGMTVPFDVVSNPEFLKEGAAVEDFMRPDRIVVGCDSERSLEVMRELYGPFTRNHERLVLMGIKEAEMTKYAANAMLATKISFMNEIANLCDRMGVDVEKVRLGIGSDARIGYAFIYPGCGYGGSCFPKDVKAIIQMAKDSGLDPLVLNAVEDRNAQQKRYLAGKIAAYFGEDLSGKIFALWGLAFKPKTDDMREASSIVLLEYLMEKGAKVRAYDPVAMEVAKRELPSRWIESGNLELVSHQYDALVGADALLLVTEWKAFRTPDFSFMEQVMKQKVIFDGRNVYDPEKVRKLGFDYYGVGR